MTTKVPRRQMGEPRFGHKEGVQGHGEVTTRQMTPEEREKYFGNKKEFGKEAYIRMKEEGKTDVEIRKMYKINNVELNAKKKQWGVLGMRTKSVNDEKPQVKKDVNHVEQTAKKETNSSTNVDNFKELYSAAKKRLTEMEMENKKLKDEKAALLYKVIAYKTVLKEEIRERG